MFKWFIAKSLVAKIIIVTSTVVLVSGATAGAIIIPKQIEIRKEEERQEQIRLENEEDLANISIELKRSEISIPLNGVVQGITIDRYPNLEEVIPLKTGEEIDKEKLTQVLKEIFVENYTGGELSVEYDSTINMATRGDYNVTFKVTSQKGNDKTENAKITVYNYFRPSVYIENETITVTKGTEIDIMQGVTFDSNLPEEEQGKIETTGTVDTDTVGTYEVIYTYIPQDEEKEAPSFSQSRTYKIIEKPSVKLNTKYTMPIVENIGGELIFTSSSNFKYTTIYSGGTDGGSSTGTYTVNGNRVTLKNSNWGEKDVIINNSNNTFYFDLDYENIN
ncbi:MAG: hypothetical protein K6B70_05160 [Clostridia bacterium]|nr:hypothetical protein [Clostridia bacterium]